MERAYLSPQQVAAYRRDGCLFPLPAMSREQAAHYLAKVEAFERDHPERAREILRSKSHVVLTWANELIRLEPVLDAVESLIGPDIYCWSTSFFIKNAGDPGYIAWHQDAPFSGMPEGEIVTAWIALTPSNPANGCLKVVAGSQKEVVPHDYRGDGANMLSAGQEIAVQVQESDATRIVLEPGQFSFHHHLIIHGSDPNTSAGRRVGIAVRYLKPFPRKEVHDTDTATLVRGVDRYNCFVPEHVPSADMDPASVEYLDRLLVKKFGDRYRKKAA